MLAHDSLTVSQDIGGVLECAAQLQNFRRKCVPESDESMHA